MTRCDSYPNDLGYLERLIDKDLWAPRRHRCLTISGVRLMCIRLKHLHLFRWTHKTITTFQHLQIRDWLSRPIMPNLKSLDNGQYSPCRNESFLNVREIVASGIWQEVTKSWDETLQVCVTSETKDTLTQDWTGELSCASTESTDSVCRTIWPLVEQSFGN